MKIIVLRGSVAILAVAACTPAFAAGGGGLIVDAGYDLFESTSATSFMGVSFVGDPIGTYNFGAGNVAVGNTDTIVQRVNAVTVAAAGDSNSTALELDALQLMSNGPTSAFGPLGEYYITLQSATGGTVSTGSMTITFASQAGGTFTSSLDVYFDLRYGSTTGAIVASEELPLSNSGDTWGRTPQAGALTMPGINLNLDGFNNAADFWPGVPLTESNPGGENHTVTNSTPEPSQWAMFAVPACLALLRRRRSRK